MSQAQIKSVQCLSPGGLHQMTYKEWGDPANRKVLVCVHGVTRVSDDFDRLAMALCDEYRVVCPDVVGRGRSGRLKNPLHYQVPQYVADMVTLLARLDASTVHWVGTSMGGLIGMSLASITDSPIRRLVLNDVGPSLNPEAIARIGQYIGQDMRFASFEEGARYIREISLPFGPHDEDEWRKLAADVLRQNEQGQWVRHCDLGLAEPFKAATPESAKQGEAMLWMAYDAIACPTLLLRGEQSDLVSHETALAMAARGPKARLVELPGVGHAPTLMKEQQIRIVRDFLLEQNVS
ncbi:alpha/beta hydrolase [Noviherbaspirillum sp. CPCC 100848]|uniref:Alpha/beta hydrolase n=1 Tax=Noviherbaspirillum album TaxID=3080276 RepID=A0ABU6JC20_9BURK|nr:alpha/beta hydrolase [Noviherbaspirillum sp. CPCC 100848]MEC4720996.1 alpha/beta hydrolase [Noviherbaspirillum sp. CPCC 100848]